MLERLKPYKLVARGYHAHMPEEPWLGRFGSLSFTERYWTRQGLEAAVDTHLEKGIIIPGSWEGKTYRADRKPIDGFIINYD